jgi:hypothetical protein
LHCCAGSDITASCTPVCTLLDACMHAPLCARFWMHAWLCSLLCSLRLVVHHAHPWVQASSCIAQHAALHSMCKLQCNQVLAHMCCASGCAVQPQPAPMDGSPVSSTANTATCSRMHTASPYTVQHPIACMKHACCQCTAMQDTAGTTQIPHGAPTSSERTSAELSQQMHTTIQQACSMTEVCSNKQI